MFNSSVLKQDKSINKSNNFIVKIFKSDKLPFFVLLVTMLMLHNLLKMQIGDDFWFQQTTQHYTLFSYVKWRYLTWTGRTTVEGVLYFIFRDNGNIWKMVNPVIITFFAYSISRIVSGSGKVKNKSKTVLNWYICFGWLLIGDVVVQSAVFWITGSINYLWPMTAGLLAIIPFRDALMKEYKGKLNIIYIGCAIFASFGHEQVSLILVGFATIINIHLFVRDKKIYKYLFIENIIIIVGTLVLFLAPGNFSRNHIETNNWLPNYPLYSKYEIGYYGMQWFLNNLLSDCRIIFMILLGVLSLALYRKNKNGKKQIATFIPILGFALIAIGILFSMDTLISSSFLKPIVKNVTFPNIYHEIGGYLNAISNFNAPFVLRKKSVIKFFIWPVMLTVIPYFTAYLYDYKMKGQYLALIYLAGICSAFVMFISPTIYVSGPRTLFVLNTMFFVLIIALVNKTKCLLKKRYLLIFGTFVILKYINFIVH